MGGKPFFSSVLAAIWASFGARDTWETGNSIIICVPSYPGGLTSSRAVCVCACAFPPLAPRRPAAAMRGPGPVHALCARYVSGGCCSTCVTLPVCPPSLLSLSFFGCGAQVGPPQVEACHFRPCGQNTRSLRVPRGSLNPVLMELTHA